MFPDNFAEKSVSLVILAWTVLQLVTFFIEVSMVPRSNNRQIKTQSKR